MKTKIIQFIPAILALLGISSRYFSLWCIDSLVSCYGSWIHQEYQYFTSPLYNFCLFFLPVAIILIFVQQSIFKSWLKFAAWAIPVSIFYIWTTPVTSGAYMDFFPFYRDDAARLAGGVFAAASLILIIWKYFSARRGVREN